MGAIGRFTPIPVIQTGHEPDVEVRPTLDDAAHARDAVLDAVLRRLQQ
jgi:hypothetical protein